MADECLFQTNQAHVALPDSPEVLNTYKVFCTSRGVYLISIPSNDHHALFDTLGPLGGVMGQAYQQLEKSMRDILQMHKSLDQIIEIDPQSKKFPYAAIEKYQAKAGFLNITKYGKPIILWIADQRYTVYLSIDDLEAMDEVLSKQGVLKV
jgi:hypothetical protein